jgi:hypothetical protein
MQDYSKHLHLVPEHMRDGLVLWIEHGIMTGNFMTALMENDLMEAMGRADDENANNIKSWCIFLYSYAPRGCFGSPERVKMWRSHKGLEGYNDYYTKMEPDWQ